MKKIILKFAILLMVLSVSCGGGQKNNVSADTFQNARSSVEWHGAYFGIIPCADCEGISVEFTLNEDETYQVSYVYIGKDNDIPAIFSGNFSWSEDGNCITLDSENLPPHYKVAERMLIQLDLEGNPITGEFADMYVLKRL